MAGVGRDAGSGRAQVAAKQRGERAAGRPRDRKSIAPPGYERMEPVSARFPSGGGALNGQGSLWSCRLATGADDDGGRPTREAERVPSLRPWSCARGKPSEGSRRDP